MSVGGNFRAAQVTRPPGGAPTAWGHGATGDMKCAHATEPVCVTRLTWGTCRAGSTICPLPLARVCPRTVHMLVEGSPPCGSWPMADDVARGRCRAIRSSA
eukprot:1062431-Prymnesium_polylepis.1